MAARSMAVGAATGLVVTASHNPAQDNGVKLVEPTGYMLQQKWEVCRWQSHRLHIPPLLSPSLLQAFTGLYRYMQTNWLFVLMAQLCEHVFRSSSKTKRYLQVSYSDFSF